MKYIIVIILVLFNFLGVNKIKAQQQSIEDFRAYYSPDPDIFLKNFIPSGFSKINHIQARGVIDSFFMEKMGEPGSTSPDINYYKRGNIVISSSVFNDSIKWHIQQAILPQVQDPHSDPNDPIVETNKKKYWNPYHSFNGSYMVEAYLVDLFGYQYLDGKILPGTSTEKRTNNTLELAYAYPNGMPAPIIKNCVLVAFDKGYRYEVIIKVYAVSEHRAEAVDVLKWIAQHIEINDNAPLDMELPY